MHEKNQFLDFSGRMGHEINQGEKISMQININEVTQKELGMKNQHSDELIGENPTGFETICTPMIYDNCMYEKLTKAMIEATDENCTVPWFPTEFSIGLIGNHTTCSNEKDVNTSYWIYYKRITNQQNDCNRPCKSMVLNIGGKNYEYNEDQTKDNQTYGIGIFYFSMTSTKTEESYLYSFSSLIADVGGYLGMLLGFSFLDFASAIQILAQKKPWMKLMATEK